MKLTITSLIILTVGLVLIGVGICLVLLTGMELRYTTYYISIPRYYFDMEMPGNYAKVKSYSLVIAHLDRESSDSVYWMYDVVSSIPWRNCSGERYIGVAFSARKALQYDGFPQLVLRIHGCRGSICEDLMSGDLLSTSSVTHGKYLGKQDLHLDRTVLDYEYLNISLTPVNIVIEAFDAVTSINCTYIYELTHPVLIAREGTPYYYHITIPSSIDTTGLRTGLALSLMGLTLIAVAIYIQVITGKKIHG